MDNKFVPFQKAKLFSRLPFFSLTPFPSSFHTVHLSLPKGKGGGRRALCMKGSVMWVELESYPVCATGQSLGGPSLGEEGCSPFFCLVKHSPHQLSSFALKQASKWTVVHGGFSGHCGAKISLCKSLSGIFAWFRACALYRVTGKTGT